jgi:hypothetical protein
MGNIFVIWVHTYIDVYILLIEICGGGMVHQLKTWAFFYLVTLGKTTLLDLYVSMISVEFHP